MLPRYSRLLSVRASDLISQGVEFVFREFFGQNEDLLLKQQRLLVHFQLSETLDTLTHVLCLLSSVFCPLPSVFCPLSSVLRLLSSALCLPLRSVGAPSIRFGASSVLYILRAGTLISSSSSHSLTLSASLFRGSSSRNFL